MAQILHSAQIFSAILLIVLILLQRTSTGETGTFGDTASFFQTRRGSEKFFFILTVVFAVVFAATSIGVVVITG
jgi:protein translocase SecG subunit